MPDIFRTPTFEFVRDRAARTSKRRVHAPVVHRLAVVPNTVLRTTLGLLLFSFGDSRPREAEIVQLARK